MVLKEEKFNDNIYKGLELAGNNFWYFNLVGRRKSCLFIFIIKSIELLTILYSIIHSGGLCCVVLCWRNACGG